MLGNEPDATSDDEATGPPALPSERSADVGFARDMQIHHAQAVEMSFLVLDRATDPLVKSMALDIATTQQHQIGQMYAWLELWGASQTGTVPPMAWMHEPGPDDPSARATGMNMDAPPPALMPGMASPADLNGLRAASGRSAERLWLRLMIRHHLGGIDMARAAAREADQPEVVELARAIAGSQRYEVDQMRSMLRQRTS